MVTLMRRVTFEGRYLRVREIEETFRQRSTSTAWRKSLAMYERWVLR